MSITTREIRGDREAFRKYCDGATFDRIRETETVGEMLASSAREWPEAPAVRYAGRTLTYAELDAAVGRARTALRGLGLQKGDRLLLHLPNGDRLLTLILAAATSGVSAAIAPAQLPKEAIAGLTKLFGCKAVAGTEADAEVCPAPVLTGTEDPEDQTPAAEVGGADECVIMFTGGTTGRSKGAVLSHRAVMQGVVNGCYGYPEVFGQRYLLSLPMSHVFGLIRGTLTALYTGGCVFICETPQSMFRDAAVFRPTMWIAVPAMAEMALSLSRQFGRMMLGDAMKVIICGAAAVPPYLTRAYDKLGIRLFPGYGLTESANLVSGNPEYASKPESVGLPFPNQTLRIAENGELLLRGDNMLTAYIGTPDPAYDAEGWFHTGDLARIDEDGFLYITGRTKEVIVLPSGENVSPAEVEARFNALPAVQDCQLFESENEHGIPILALEVVPRAAELKGVEDVNAFLMPQLEEVNASLPAFQQAARIVIRDKDFERSPSMKILRYKRNV